MALMMAPLFGQNSGENLGKARRKKMMCKISGKSAPLPPLTEESPYAHAQTSDNRDGRPTSFRPTSGRLSAGGRFPPGVIHRVGLIIDHRTE